MKKIFIIIAVLLASLPGFSQYIQGSIQQNVSTPNAVDITFLPDFDSQSGESINYISISIAIPTANATGVVPVITTTGTDFAGLNLTKAIPFSYTAGTETIFSWVYSSGTISSSWLGMPTPTELIGATITFYGGTGSAPVRLIDFKNSVPAGGNNSNTYFLVVTNKHHVGTVNTSDFDVTYYPAMFYQNAGSNSPGTYGNGNQYVETAVAIDLCSGSPNAGSIPTGLTACITGSSTIQYSNNGGDPGGIWSSTNTAVATINASTGLLTKVATGTTTIRYTVTDCSGTPIFASRSLTLNDPGTVSGASPICIGGTTLYTRTGSDGGLWSSASPTIASVPASQSGPTVTVTGVAAGGPIAIRYTVSGCTAAFQNITVSPNVSVSSVSGTTPLCIGGNATYTKTGSSGGTWSSTNTAVATVNASTGAVSAVGAGSTDITYTLTGCGGPLTAFQTLVVNPNVSAGTISGASPLCIGQTDTYTSNGTSGGTWSSTVPGVATVDGSGLVTAVSAGTTNITYTVNSGCGAPVSAFRTLTVDPTVSAGTVSGSTPLCIGATTTYSSNGTTGGSWSSTVPGVATVHPTSGLVTAVSAGATDISYTVNTGCGSPVSAFKTLTVDPTVSAGTVSGSTPLCIGATTTYSSNGTAGGAWSSTAPGVATVHPTSGLVTAIAAGTTDITYTVSSGCGSPVSAFKTLTVDPTVSAGTVSGSTPLCIGQTTTYSSNGTAGGSWSSTNPSAATVNASSGLVTAVAAGTTNITYTVSTGCGSPVSAFKTLTVDPTVSAGTVSGSTPLCIGQTTTYSSNGTSGGAWSSTNTGAATVNASSGLVTAVGAGTTNITYTVSTGCGSPVSAFKTLTVNPSANAGTVSGAATLSVAQTSTFTSNGNSGGQWSSTNTSVATVNASSGFVTALAVGTTDITYTVNTGCNSPVSSFATLSVTDRNIITSSIQKGAVANTIDVQFTPNYTSADGEYVNYMSISIAVPTASAAGVTPTLVATGPFTGMTFNHGIPFSYTAGTETIWSWVYNSGPTSMSWNEGEEFNGATIIFNGGNGTSKVRMVDFRNYVPAGGNNSNTYFLVVTNKTPFDKTNYAAMFYGIAGPDGSVTGTYPNTDQYVETSSPVNLAPCNPDPNPGEISGTSPLCIGATATYTSNGDGGGTWSSTNPSVATVNVSSGLVSAVAAGTTDITYTVNGCGGTISSFKTLTVSPNVTAGSVSGTTPLCIGGTATYTSDGTAGGSWTSTNTAVATVNASSGLVTAVSAGTTDITYTVSAGCGNPVSSFQTLTVNPNVSAGTVSGSTPLCIGQTASYTSNGTGGGSWSSTNTAVATVNPSSGLVTAVSAGTTDITYTVSSGCGSPVSSFKTLTVNPNVSAGTVSGSSPICIGGTTTYSSNGTPGGSWSSTNTSVATVNASSGLVTAVAAGTTDITYTVSTGCGSPVSSFENLIVSPNVSAGTVSGTTPLCIGGTATYSSNGTAGGSWSSTNTTVATVNASSGLVTALAAGTTNITYTVSTGCGSPVSAFKTLTVDPNGSAGTVSGATPLCIGATTIYTSNGTAGGSWTSTNTGVATVNASTGLVTAVGAGNTNITYTVSPGCGSPVSAFKTLTVNPNVSAGTVSGTATLSVGTTATYTSNGAAGGTWSSTNPAIATVNASSGLVTAIATGTTDITYTVNTGCGSPVSSFQTLTVTARHYITGSIQKGAIANSVDIQFTPNYTSDASEYVNYLSISIAIPTASAAGVTPVLTATGPFAGMALNHGIPFSYTAGTETIWSWVYNSGPTSMSWEEGEEFTGANISFTGGTGLSKVRMVDFRNYVPAGGNNSNTYFLIVTNKTPFDKTNYAAMFYSIAGPNGSVTGNYPNTDQFVETSANVNMNTCNAAPNAGIVSGTTPLCIGATATYTSNGNAGGSWSSTNTAVATVNASSGLVSAVGAGTTDITYTVNGCDGPVSSFKTLTVAPNVSAGTVSGSSPLCIGQTDTYTSDGTAGGTWSSTNTAVATVNPSSGLVTAVAAGTTDITYTLTGCGGPLTAFATLTVNPTVSAGTVSGSTPLCIGQTDTYSSNGTAGGSWSSTNTGVATVNASSGLVTAVAAGTTDITYTISSGCGSPVSAFKTLTVNANVSAGTVSGSTPLCIGATATYTNDGTAGGSWSSTNTAVATVNASSGLVTAVSAGTTDITYTVNTGCGSPVSSFQTLTVNPNVSAGTVNGTTPLCVGTTDTYTSTGTSGGIWSSTNTGVATVNASSGLVTAVGAGTTNITYSVNSGCGSPVSSFKTLTVNADGSAGTVSGTTPLCAGSTTTYTSDGIAGGTWSSTNTSVATVNASTGLVTAVSAGTTNITYTVTGCSGPVSSFKTLTVDMQAPVVTCPGNLNITSTNCTKSVVTVNPTFNDNCSVVTLTWALSGATTASSLATGINYVGTRTFNVGVTTVTYTAKDPAGNPGSCSFTVTVKEGTKPTLTCLASITANADVELCSKFVTLGHPTYNDNCGVVSLTWVMTGANTGSSPSTGINFVASQAFNVGVTTITYSAADLSGNIKTCSFKVTIIDNQFPVVTCPGNISENLVSGCSKNVVTPNPGYGDNCTVASLTWKLTGATSASSATSGINFVGTRAFNSGVTTVTNTIKDASGNVSTCSFMVTIIDDIDPVLTCPGNISATTTTSCNKSVSTPNPVYSDNCSVTTLTWVMTGVTTGSSASTGVNKVGSKTFNIGVTTITYTASDAAGNTVVCSFTVTVSDLTPPSVNAPGNISMNVTSCNATIATSNPTATDNCSLASLKWTMTGATIDNSPVSGFNYVGSHLFNVGITTITYTGTDIYGNVGTDAFTITIKENVNPVITCPAPSSFCGGTGAYTIPPLSASDNCAVTSVTYVITGATSRSGVGNNASGTFNAGNSTIKWTVKDASLNTVTCSSVVTVSPTLCRGVVTSPDEPVVTPVVDFGIKVSPNPTNSYFSLRIQSSAEEAVMIRIFSIDGKVIEQQQGNVNQVYRFGDRYISGTYVVEVRQGVNRKTNMVIKQ